MTYPAVFTLDAPDRLARWRPLVQWILAIPHFVALYIFGVVAQIVVVVAWFAIVITGKLPAGMASIIVAYNRYNARVLAYAGFLHDRYPPFDFPSTNDDPGGHPVGVSFEPALEGRNRLTVLLRFLWIIPAYIFFVIVYIAASILWIVGFFAVIVTGGWPQGILNFITGVLRCATRFGAYVFLLTDEYPPFNLD